MNLPRRCSSAGRKLQPGTRAAFTLVEVMVASGILVVVVAGALAFANVAGISLSGVTAQNGLVERGGGAINFLQSRARLATSMTNDASGNVLTLGFDDNPKFDSDGDGKSYNDRNHFERFMFVGVNSTNVAGCATNRLVYIPNIATSSSRVLIPKGVRNLPGQNIFTITNQVIAIIRLGVVDHYERDFYQAIDLQGTAVSLNRPAVTNTITILP